MAKVELDAPFQRFTGKIGKLSYRWMYGKQTVMKTPDMSKVKWSEAQKANRERFRQAITSARQAMADPKIRAHYEKVGKKANRQAFRVAVSDFCQGKNLLEKK
jgi:DnaJ-class molecular chaperone